MVYTVPETDEAGLHLLPAAVKALKAVEKAFQAEKLTEEIMNWAAKGKL